MHRNPGTPSRALTPAFARSMQLNGNQLRSGVDYMVPAGAELAFGQEAPTWTAQFTEAEVNDAMAKLMMNAMAQGASDDVKKRLDNM